MGLLSTRRVFVIILGLGLLAMAARGVHDPDVWWHLRAGQEIVASHQVPHQDSFSYTRYGQPWIAHEWLSEAIFYLIFRATGWAGLMVAFAGLIAATFLLLYRQCAGRPYVAGLVVALGAIATIPSWGVRPQMFSMLLAAIFLWLLAKARASDPGQLRFLWWTPVLMLLWVNLHGGFLLGPALMAITLAGWLVEAWLGLTSWPQARTRATRLGIALAACVAVIPLNPNGLELYRYPFQTLQARTIVNYIVEWASPNFHSTDFKPFLGLLLLTWLVVAVSRKRPAPTQILLLLATAYGGLSAARHIPIFALVAVPILAEGLEELAARQQWFSAAEQTSLPPAKLAINLVLVLAVAGLTGLHFYQVIKSQAAGESKNFPKAATEFLVREHVPAPIFNYYDWGGYFIARLYPQYRVFIDGRTDLYGSLMDTFSDTARGEGNWREGLQKYHVRTVVVPPASGLAGLLRLDGGWKKAFEDKQAVVFVKAGSF
ncbi:MAG TPA: hypothetical protein VGR48_19275 [Terriglobales bacterium]|nr:hypothetical protein [Terriglobales bacterium]